MNKIIADIISPDELNEWSFPHLNILLQAELGQLESLNNLEQQEVDNKPTVQDENEKIMLDLTTEKLQYQEKNQILSNIFQKLDDSLAVFDKELVDMMQDIIKRSVKKIIYKEVKTDAKLIEKMIQELKPLIQSHNGIINVFLSEVDYKRLDINKQDASMSVHVNPSLAAGDIIIKSNFSEVRAILSERIDKVFGAKK